jgi:hypothetical protein
LRMGQGHLNQEVARRGHRNSPAMSLGGRHNVMHRR